jgi:hypothetical protein
MYYHHYLQPVLGYEKVSDVKCHSFCIHGASALIIPAWAYESRFLTSSGEGGELS